MTLHSKRILLTGATGYIGGTVLTTLLQSTTRSQSPVSISCLLRGQDRADRLTAAYGDRVRPILYEGLDDLEATTRAAAQHDIVINTTLGYHATSALALVRGLKQRKAETGQDVWLIHTSGVSNIGDRPITQPDVLPHDWDDLADDVYAFEKKLEMQQAYAQRTTELAVIDTGLEAGVKTIVIMSPIIYGFGTGLFNRNSIQTMMIRPWIEMGRGIVVGDGSAEWDHVHVEDLADLYELVLLDMVEKDGQSIPTGRAGIMFSANGRHTWLGYVQEQIRACHELGYISESRVDCVALEKADEVLAPYLGWGTTEGEKGIQAESFASNSKTIASLARQLGWNPVKGEDAWRAAFRDDAKVVKASMNQV